MHRFRLLLLPFSWIYGLVTIIRNWMFDKGYLSSYAIGQKSILIGNITVGGTGKSPMTQYITELFLDKNPVILSRGYGRNTKGARIATASDTAETIGDEPQMYRVNFDHKVPIVVAEKRVEGIKLIEDNFPASLVILDDAFQHRYVTAGLQIVLMTYDKPIFKDFPFPAGNLREHRSGLKRSDIVVVTKCPKDLTPIDKNRFAKKLKIEPSNLFFSTIQYTPLKPLFHTENKRFDIALLVTGIGQPIHLIKALSKQFEIIPYLLPDHHPFTLADIEAIHQKVANFATRECAVITTEKDAVKLLQFKDNELFKSINWFSQDMEISIDRTKDFQTLLTQYVTSTNTRIR